MDYFGEKVPQVESQPTESFGIPITSRYSKASEIAEMLLFTQKLAEFEVHQSVLSVFYYSNACICNIEVDPSVKEGDPTALEIWAAAEETLGQYELFGVVGHGKKFRQEDVPEPAPTDKRMTKQEKFLYIVQMSVAANSLNLTTQGAEKIEKYRHVISMTGTFGIAEQALRVSEKIPASLPAEEAANEFLTYILDNQSDYEETKPECPSWCLREEYA